MVNFLFPSFAFPSPSFFFTDLINRYDSNHIAHTERYLEIFSPFKNAPSLLREIVGGNSGLKNMKLGRGDFIEDKFGQSQRNVLVRLSKEDPEKMRELFLWFG